jgi:hypothetical protein
VGASIVGLPWSLLLLVGGGQVGVLALLALSLLGGCALGALRLALREPDREAPAVVAPPLFGPVGYSGPGSLGGGEPAIRVRR